MRDGGRPNRVLLALIGIVLLGTGVLVLIGGLDLQRHWDFALPDGWPYATPHDVLLGDQARARYRHHGWWWPTVIGVLAALVTAALWWLPAQLRSRRLRQVRVGGGSGDPGEPTLLRGRALEEIIAGEAESFDGVTRAHVLLTGRPDAPRARIVLALAPRAQPAAALADLDRAVVARARISAALPALSAEARLRAVSHRAARVT
jgi:hypothetical protein